MAEVEVTPQALRELAAVPRPIQLRIAAIFERLRRWPQVSGAKPLSERLKGSWRIRTGDYRVVFRTAGDDRVIVWKIGLSRRRVRLTLEVNQWSQTS